MDHSASSGQAPWEMNWAGTAPAPPAARSPSAAKPWEMNWDSGPSGTNKALTQFAGESAAELRQIPRDIDRGITETAEDIGQGYIRGAEGHVGPAQVLYGAYGAGKGLMGSPAGGLAADIGMSGAPLEFPTQRGTAHDTARTADSGRDLDLRMGEGLPGIPGDQTGGRAAPPEVRPDVSREVESKTFGHKDNPEKDVGVINPTKGQVRQIFNDIKRKKAENRRMSGRNDRPVMIRIVESNGNIYIADAYDYTHTDIYRSIGTTHDLDLRLMDEGINKFGRKVDHEISEEDAKSNGYDLGKIIDREQIGVRNTEETKSDINTEFDQQMAENESGLQSLGAQAGPPGKAPGVKATHANVIEQELEHYKLANREQLRRTEVRQATEAKPKELTPEVEQKLYAHAENDFSAGRLTDEEEALYEKHIEPIRERNKDIFKEIRSEGKKLGVFDEEIDDLHPGYMHRMRQGGTPDLDRAMGLDDQDPGTGASMGYGGTYQAPGTKSRSYFALVDKSGARKIIHVESGHVYDAATGKLVKSRQKLGDNFRVTPGAKIDGSTVAHAKTSEIEAVSDVRYIKSASASVWNNYLELERMRDRLALVRRTQERFIHEGMATRNIKEAREFKWASTKFPGMQGVYMDKRLAAAMDKFAPRDIVENVGEYMLRVQRFMTSSLFWNPLPHARNVFMHAMIERSWDNFKPWTYPGAAIDARRAFTDVSTNSELYQEAQIHGAATMFPRIANRHVFEDLVKGMEKGQSQAALAALAAKMGVPAHELYDLVYVRFAQQSLWFSNDMAIMQRVREKIRRVPGMTVSKAVEELHKDIPDYRIPSEVLFPGKPGRMFSQLIGHRYIPIVSVFNRFHYSVMKTYLYPCGDIVEGLKNIKDPAARREGINAVGKMVSLAAAYEAMNLVGNKAVQHLTGDERSRIAMWGPLAMVRIVADLASGRTRSPADFAKAATGGLLSFSPFAEIVFQGFGLDYRMRPDWELRKAGDEIRKGKDVRKNLATVAEKVAGQALAPVQQARKYYEGGPSYALADVTTGVGHTPRTEKEEAAYKKTPSYKTAHPRKPRVRNESSLPPSFAIGGQ